MLRHVVGDSVFFQSMRQYANDPRFRFGTATTDGFRSVFEAVSGKDLSYFFNEWIYGESCPSYNYDWGYLANVPNYTARVTLRQTTGTSNPSFFKMPIDFRFAGAGLDTTFIVMNYSPNQTFVFTLPKQPTAFQLDPGTWILQKTPATGTLVNVAQTDGEPREFALLQNYPNPFNPSTIIPFELPVSSIVRIEIFNVLGGLVGTLVNDQLFDAGRHTVQFNGAAIGGSPLSSGVYYYRLKISGAVIQTKKMVYLR
jgi:hypothetical protein